MLPKFQAVLLDIAIDLLNILYQAVKFKPAVESRNIIVLLERDHMMYMLYSSNIEPLFIFFRFFGGE